MGLQFIILLFACHIWKEEVNGERKNPEVIKLERKGS